MFTLKYCHKLNPMLKEVAHTHVRCWTSTSAVCFYISQGMLPRDTTCTFLQTDEHGKRQDKMVEVHEYCYQLITGGREGVGGDGAWEDGVAADGDGSGGDD